MTTKKQYKIEGMTCANCSKIISLSLKKTKGIDKVDVSLVLEKALVEYDESSIKEEEIIKKVEELGYKAIPIEEKGSFSFFFKALEPKKDIKEVLKNLNGIKDFKISKDKAFVKYDPSIILKEEIIYTLKTEGYDLIELLEEENFINKIKIFTIISSLLSTFFLLDMFVKVPYHAYLEFIIGTVIQVIGALVFYKGALSSLKAKIGNMDLLVSLGSTAAYIFSLLAFFNVINEKPFFETSSFLITFILIGKYIELKARTKANFYLKNLLQSSQRFVTLLEDGKEVRKDIYDIKKDDQIILRSGDKVSLDVEVLKGNALIDYSVITGETVPVSVKEGDNVLSGAIILDGFLIAKVVREASSSYLSEIIKALESSLSKKAKIESISDRVAYFFVPLVILLSLITFFVWFFIFHKSLEFSFSRGLSVLVVSCPCAMGIAVPLAFSAGLMLALKNKIIVKNPESFEKSAKAKFICFDKTGTLTQNKPRVVSYKSFIEEGEFLELSLYLESFSNHPYAKAIRDFCLSKVSFKDFNKNCNEEIGFGVICNEIIATSGSFWNTDFSVGIGTRERLFGGFYIEDTLNENAKLYIEKIKALNLKTCILSGDSKNNVEKVARELNIESFKWGLKPEEKKYAIKEIKKDGIVIMVGDGINDVSALIESDVGISITKATDIAKASTDVVIEEGHIDRVYKFLRISKKTYSKMKQNLFWAFLYNAVLIPISAGIFYKFGILLKPEFAGLAMSFSSITVVFNSFSLLKLYKD